MRPEVNSTRYISFKNTALRKRHQYQTLTFLPRPSAQSSPTGLPVISLILSELMTSAREVKLNDDFLRGLKISDGDGGSESESVVRRADEEGKGINVG